MLEGYQKTQRIHVAAKLGIADKLKDGPKTTEEIAQATGAQPRNLYRVLRTLVGLGIFPEDQDGRFQLTSLSEHLTSDVPNPM
jgi:DNA-binding IclR family transcriptional regulator